MCENILCGGGGGIFFFFFFWGGGGGYFNFLKFFGVECMLEFIIFVLSIHSLIHTIFLVYLVAV